MSKMRLRSTLFANHFMHRDDQCSAGGSTPFLNNSDLFHTIMSLQQPDPSFHAIVRLETGIPMWAKLEGDDDPLVQLHSKFWGKKLTLEDPELSSPQPAESDLMDEDKPIDVDDDDFPPGCAILDIGIDDLPFQKIWIRADYIRVYDFIESREAPNRMAVNLLPPAAVVTGQPGIGELSSVGSKRYYLHVCMRKGKSVWIYYALCRRLVDRKAVIWYQNQACYLFSKEGVFRSPVDFPSTGFRFFVWTLVDSDQSSEGPPPHLLCPGTRLYVIYVTSPRKARWERMKKTVRDVRVIMNPWTRREIDIAWVSFQLLNEFVISKISARASIFYSDHTGLNRVYEQLGPIPRLCLDYLHDDSKVRIKQYERDIQYSVSSLSTESLETLFDNAGNLDMGQLSHKICLLSRGVLEDVTSPPIVKPVTPYVHSKLVCRLRTLERTEQVRLYKRFAKTRESRAVAGVAFEAAGQAMLQDGVDLELIPMVHYPPSQATPLPPWHSSHLHQQDKNLEQLRQVALEKSLSLPVRPSGIFEYRDDRPLSIQHNVFYLPEMTNQVAFDAFILLNGILYLFQFTIRDHYDFKPGVKKFFATCIGIPPIEKWQIVFVIPPNHTLIVSRPWPLDIRAIPFYSAMMTL